MNTKKPVALKDPPPPMGKVLPFCLPKGREKPVDIEPTPSPQGSGWIWLIIFLALALVALPYALAYFGKENVQKAPQNEALPTTLPEAKTETKVKLQEQEVPTVVAKAPAPIQAEQLETWQWLVFYYQTTGQAENDALGAAEELAKAYPDWAAEYGISTLSTLLVTSIEPEAVPFYERCAKLAQRFNPNLQSEIDEAMNRLSESSQTKTQDELKADTPKADVSAQTEVPLIPFLVIDPGISIKYGFDPVTKRPIKVQVADNQWQVIACKTAGRLTLLTLKQVSPASSSPIIIWLGIPTTKYEIGQEVEGKDLQFP